MKNNLNRVIESCESTNLVLKKAAEEGVEDRSWISSRVQTKGRGRLGRHWISEPGNLFLSILLKEIPKEAMSWIPHFTSVLLCDSLIELNSQLKPVIKWPNDVGIFHAGLFKKGSGILCEGVISSTGNNIIVGIGVNCRTDVTTDRETMCFYLSEDELRKSIIKKMKDLIFKDKKSIKTLKDKYFNYSLLKENIELEWSPLSDTQSIQRGVFKCFGEFGELIVVREDSKKEVSLYSEEIKIKI